MSLRIFILGVATTILSAGLAPPAGAQVWQPFGPVNYRHDFAPFETFDIKNMSAAPDPQEGYFFTFDKLNWVVQGEHNTLGNPNVVDFVPDLLPGLASPQVFNGITDTAPEATFGWGERYEFGYVIDHHGWGISVLDGPDVSDVEQYGFNSEILDDPANDAIIITPEPNAAVGNVVILFEFPQNGSFGFLHDINGIPFDINLDGVINDDDLISYVPSFEQVTVRNHTDLDGVEVMKMYRFKPSSKGSVVEFSYGARYLRLNDNFRVDAYGGIFNEIEGVTPVAAALRTDRTSFWDTTIDNHIVGPQVSLRWTKRQGRFTYNASGRFTFGYNVQDHDQVGQVITAHDYEGETNFTVTPVTPTGTGGVFIGGAGPILLPNSAFRHGKQEHDFSPLVEFRTGVNYHLTQDFALTLGFNATFIDNVRRASTNVAYVLPNMGFRDGGTQEIFTAGVNFGVEFNR